jgi:2'-5' RNA ligase
MDDFTFDNGRPGSTGDEWDCTPPQDRPHLLIALFPDGDTRRAIEKHREDWLWPAGRRFPPGAHLHLTLHSLPDLSADDTMHLRTALSKVRMDPLDLVLDSSCTWKNDISVVLPAEHEKLRTLRSDIAGALRRVGFETDRKKWTPHITIARKTAQAARPQHLAPIRWTSTNFTLVRTHPSPPAWHEVLTSYRAG